MDRDYDLALDLLHLRPWTVCYNLQHSSRQDKPRTACISYPRSPCWCVHTLVSYTPLSLSDHLPKDNKIREPCAAGSCWHVRHPSKHLRFPVGDRIHAREEADRARTTCRGGTARVVGGVQIMLRIIMSGLALLREEEDVTRARGQEAVALHRPPPTCVIPSTSSVHHLPCY
jgi:hypothetical protein